MRRHAGVTDKWQQWLLWITVTDLLCWPMTAVRDGKLSTEISNSGSLLAFRLKCSETPKCQECWENKCCEPSNSQAPETIGSDYVIIADTSTSVGNLCGHLVDLVQQLRSTLLRSGNDIDHVNRVAVVEFNSVTKIIHGLICKDQHRLDHVRAIDNMKCSGATYTHNALKAASQLLLAEDHYTICRAHLQPGLNRKKHIIFLSDGDPSSTSDREASEELSNELRRIYKVHIASVYLVTSSSSSGGARRFMQAISDEYSEMRFRGSIIENIVDGIMEQQEGLDKCRGCSLSVCFPPPPPPPPPVKEPCVTQIPNCAATCAEETKGQERFKFTKFRAHENQANLLCYPNGSGQGYNPTCSCQACCQGVARTCDDYFLHTNECQGETYPIFNPRGQPWDGTAAHAKTHCCRNEPYTCGDIVEQWVVRKDKIKENVCASVGKVWHEEVLLKPVQVIYAILEDQAQMTRVFVDACCVHKSCLDFGFNTTSACEPYFTRPLGELQAIRRKNNEVNLTKADCCFGVQCDHDNLCERSPLPGWLANPNIITCDTRACGPNWAESSTMTDACCREQCCIRARSCLDFAKNFQCPTSRQLISLDMAALATIPCHPVEGVAGNWSEICSSKDEVNCCEPRPRCQQFWETFPDECVEPGASINGSEYEKIEEYFNDFCAGRTCSLEDKPACCRKSDFCSEWRVMPEPNGCMEWIIDGRQNPDTRYPMVVLPPNLAMMINKLGDTRLPPGFIDHVKHLKRKDGELDSGQPAFHTLLQIRELCCDPFPTCADPQYVDICKVPGWVRKPDNKLFETRGELSGFPKRCSLLNAMTEGARECTVQDCCEPTCENFPCHLPKYRKTSWTTPIWPPCSAGECDESQCCTFHTCATTEHICQESEGKALDSAKFLSNEPCRDFSADKKLYTCSDDECCQELPTCASELTRDFCNGGLTTGDVPSDYVNKPDFDSIICKTTILDERGAIQGYTCSLNECCDPQHACAKVSGGSVELAFDCKHHPSKGWSNGGGRCPFAVDSTTESVQIINYSEPPTCFATKPNLDMIVCQVGKTCTPEEDWDKCCYELASCQDAEWICLKSDMYLRPNAHFLFCGQDGCNEDDRDFCCLPPPTCMSPTMFPCHSFPGTGTTIKRSLRAEAEKIKCVVDMERWDRAVEAYRQAANEETLDATLRELSCSRTQMVPGQKIKEYANKQSTSFDDVGGKVLYTFQSPFFRNFQNRKATWDVDMNLNAFLCCDEPLTCTNMLPERDYCTFPRWEPKRDRQDIAWSEDPRLSRAENIKKNLERCCDPRPTCESWIQGGCKPDASCPPNYTKENGGKIPILFSNEDDAYCPRNVDTGENVCTVDYCYYEQPPLCLDYACGVRLQDTPDAYFLVSRNNPAPCQDSDTAYPWLVRCSDDHCCLPVTCGSQYEQYEQDDPPEATPLDCSRYVEPDPGFFPEPLKPCGVEPCLKPMMKSNSQSLIWNHIPCAAARCTPKECCKAPEKPKFAPWFRGHHYSGGMNGGSEEFRTSVGDSLHITTLAMTTIKKAEAYGVSPRRYNELVRQGAIWDPDRSPRHTMPDWMLEFFLQVGQTGHNRGDVKDKDCPDCDRFELLARWYYLRENGRQKSGRMTPSEICNYLLPHSRDCETMFEDVREEEAHERLRTVLNQKKSEARRKTKKDRLVQAQRPRRKVKPSRTAEAQTEKNLKKVEPPKAVKKSEASSKGSGATSKKPIGRTVVTFDSGAMGSTWVGE